MVVQRTVGRVEASTRELLLVPIGIDQRDGADLVETLALFPGQFEVDGSQVVLELHLVPPADHQ